MLNNKEFSFQELTNFDTFSPGFSSFYDDTLIIESDNRNLLKIKDWLYSNLSGDRQIIECWVSRYNTQNGTAITLMGTCPKSRS